MGGRIVHYRATLFNNVILCNTQSKTFTRTLNFVKTLAMVLYTTKSSAFIIISAIETTQPQQWVKDLWRMYDY
jgi:hypothetical protein